MCNLNLSEQLVRLVVKVMMQNDREFVKVILLCLMCCLSIFMSSGHMVLFTFCGIKVSGNTPVILINCTDM